jgi:hypothetical protein
MPEPVAPNQPFTITLEAQQWNGVLGALSDAPYRVAAPLIQAISGQLQTQAPQTANGLGMPEMPPPPQQPH